MKVGDSLLAKIQAGVSDTDFFAIAISRAALQSQWVKKELQLAIGKELKEREIVILPLLLERVQVPTYLRTKFFADLTTPLATLQSLPKLLRTLGVTSHEIRMEAFSLASRFGRVPTPRPDSHILRRLPTAFTEALHDLEDLNEKALRRALYVRGFLSALQDRHSVILQMRLGLSTGRPMSYREVSKYFASSPARIKALENEALALLSDTT